MNPERIVWQAEALAWPLTTSNNLGERLAPDGERKAGWQVHIRCGRPQCAQSILCTSNDSGAYAWSVGGELLTQLRAHIAQAHREDQSSADDR
jgi:hypothetical protein